MTKSKWTFEQFSAVNKENAFTSIDYVHAISKFVKLPDDFYLCMARLFCPSFFKMEDVIFILETFRKSEYDEYINIGCSVEKAQPWINKIEITSIFDGIAVDAARQISDLIVDIWNRKLEVEFGKASRLARVVVDLELEEVFVTIGNFERCAVKPCRGKSDF
ncbi:hypothetical protein [Cupriavidus sp. PET2-C1]